MLNSKNNNKKQKKNPPLPAQAISAYTEGADPLGSYTGITNDMPRWGNCMPRRDVGGKIYMKLEEEKPVQDADDL
ncbi:MAG: hypothetical protein IJO00_00670 [Clostridia bacterium]|nr:hypothetical protein [Clostridia bacterium]